MNSSTPSSAAAGAPFPAPAAGGFSIKPLMFEAFACTLAMMSFVALIGPIARMLGLLPWQAGLAVTVGGIAWALCARRWGAASDRLGRRRILLQGLGGFVLSYAALCGFVVAALRQPPPPWLAFGGVVLLRGVAGGFYAAVPATGALPLVSLAVLWRWLPRSERHAAPDGAKLRIGDARLRRPLAVAFAAMFSVIVAQVAVGFFALDRLHLDATAAAGAAGMALTASGVALILAQLLVRSLGWPPQRLIRIGCAVSAVGFGSVLFATSSTALWLGYFISAAGMGWVFPSVTALAANAVQANEQGATAGTIAAAQGLGMIAGPLAGTLVYGIDPGAPYALVALLLALAALWPARRQHP